MSNEGVLTGSCALITGGGRGIGKAIALAMAAAGADVAVTYVRDQAAAQAAVDQIQRLGRRAVALHYDAGAAPSGEALVARVVQALGKIDLVVNNAGVFEPVALLELEHDPLQQTFQKNVFAPFDLTQAAARRMIRDGIRGCMVNISSVAWDHPRPGVVHYAASKAALTMLTKGAAIELAPHGIRVNAIAPGLVTTDMNAFLREKEPQSWQAQVARIPLGRPGVPEDLAGAAVFLASPQASWLTGVCLTADGGRTIG